MADQGKAAEENTEGNRGSVGLRQRQYWVGLALGIVLLAAGLWLGEYYIVCIGGTATGSSLACTFGSMETNEIVGSGIIIGGAVISVASLVGIVWSRRRNRINMDTKGEAHA